MIRVVLDTNVLVSAGIKTNSPPFLVVRWCARFARILKSDLTERELLAVLERPSIISITSLAFRDGLRAMTTAAERVDIRTTVRACRDVKDNKFLDLAVNGRADVLITGDDDLLSLDALDGIPIIKPAAFVQGILR